jgi:hypothetical protein
VREGTLSKNLEELVAHYKSDPESAYNRWFIQSDARLAAFHSIPRGVTDVVTAITDGTFGNDFKGSPLEPLLASITEQGRLKGTFLSCLSYFRSNSSKSRFRGWQALGPCLSGISTLNAGGIGNGPRVLSNIHEGR